MKSEGAIPAVTMATLAGLLKILTNLPLLPLERRLIRRFWLVDRDVVIIDGRAGACYPPPVVWHIFRVGGVAVASLERYR